MRRFQSTELLCPRCAGDFTRRRSHLRLLIWLALFIGAVALAIHDKSDGAARVVANLLFIYPLLHVAVIPHEVGHALAAWLVGFEVISIQIGHGTPLWSATVAGIEISHGSVPLGGQVQFGTKSTRWWRTRDVFVSFAGPAANLACLWAAIHFASDEKIDASILPGLYILPGWIIANLMVALANLLPARDRKTGIPSDGLAIWTRLWNPITDETRNHLRVSAPLLKSLQFLLRSKYESAQRHARRAHDLDPTLPATQLTMAVTLFYQGNITEAEAYLQGLLKSEDPRARTPEFRASLSSQLALINILSPDPTRWPVARELAAAAYHELPWDNGVALVHGACVALTDGIERGIKVLDTVIPKTKATRDFCIYVRALALARAGRLNEARDVLATARPPRHFDVFKAAIDNLLVPPSSTGH